MILRLQLLLLLLLTLAALAESSSSSSPGNGKSRRRMRRRKVRRVLANKRGPDADAESSRYYEYYSHTPAPPQFVWQQQGEAAKTSSSPGVYGTATVVKTEEEPVALEPQSEVTLKLQTSFQ